MKLKRLLFFCMAAPLFIATNSCNKNPDDNSLNIFSVDDDINLGKQVKAEIAANPSEYPIISEASKPAAYQYLRNIVSKILNTKDSEGKYRVYYREKFAWEVYIINRDDVVNAFCVPGGYMYVYTGLIKYLESEDELAGVMGHEMAHADRRHTTDQLTKQYGIQLLLQIALGNNNNVLTDIAANMLLLKYGRDAETEADEYAVKYLCPTDWKADGFKHFFQKLEADGGGGGSDFFSTHPSPDKRVENITNEKAKGSCSGANTYSSEYAAFKASF